MSVVGLGIWRHIAGHGYGRLTCLLPFMMWRLPAPYDETCIEASILQICCQVDGITSGAHVKTCAWDLPSDNRSFLNSTSGVQIFHKVDEVA